MKDHKVLGVIAVRLNSSRLPKKQLLDLAGKPLIARLIERLESSDVIDALVIATTDDDYNKPLVEWASTNKKDIFIYSGDVNDLIGRLDAVVQQYSPTIVAYFCGDSPLIEPITVFRMIDKLMQCDKDVLVILEPAPDGKEYIHEGFAIYTRYLWDKLVHAANLPEEREHVGQSLKHIWSDVKSVYINEDPVYCKMQHRISVDTSADYRFMQEIYQRWYRTNTADSIVSLSWVVDELIRDTSLKNINNHVQQRKVNKPIAKVLIVTQAGKTVGLGHLTRSIVLAETLQESAKASVRLLIEGVPFYRQDLQLLNHQFIQNNQLLSDAVKSEIDQNLTEVVIFDFSKKLENIEKDSIHKLLSDLQGKKLLCVAIDSLFDLANQLDYIHVPSFYIPSRRKKLFKIGLMAYGWEYYILRDCLRYQKKTINAKLIVAIGGADSKLLATTLPSQLDRNLPPETEIHWVKGPFASAPKLPTKPRLHWCIHSSPEQLYEIACDAQCVLTAYGVTFYEMLLLNKPTVVFNTQYEQFAEEMLALEKEQVAVVVEKIQDVPAAVSGLMNNMTLAHQLAENAKSKLKNKGADIVLNRILALKENVLVEYIDGN